jgi:ATP adenylyltransferase
MIMMKRLWAPWRGEYVTAAGRDGCIFCEKPRVGNDEAERIICRSASSFSMLNRFPYNGGHLMVAPFRHVGSMEELTDEELTDLFKLVRNSVALVKCAMKAEGCNVGINLGRVAGAGVDAHIHVHVVPRWSGDVNFMPVIADTKVVSQSLDDVYRLLVENAVRM